jgi:multiple sugar transport system permease protein
MISISYKLQKKIIIVTFLFLPILLMLAFAYYPAVRLFQYSITDWNGASRELHYIGMGNYTEILRNADYRFISSNNLVYFGAAFIQIVFGLLLAVILNAKLKGVNFARSVIFMPYIMNGAAIAYIFNFMYNYEQSPINQFLKLIGLGKYAIRFISDSYWTNLPLALIGVWSYTGFFMVLYIGALQSVPVSFYEAADIDGANFLQKLWFITIPNIRTVIELTVFLGINGSVQTFIQPLLVTQGGPGIRTETIVSYILKVAFKFSNYGLASALGVVVMFAVIILVSIQQFIMKSREE